jgi:cell division protein FtsI/penicillin-binding protein 2
MAGELLDTSRARLSWAFPAIAIVVTVLVAQMVRWTVWPHTAPASDAPPPWAPNAGRIGDSPRARGNILDVNGALLVATGYHWEISISPNIVSTSYVKELAGKLAPLIDYPQQELEEHLMGSSQYILLGRYDYEVGVAVAALDERAIGVVPIPRRVYPEGMLASHVLGFLNLESQPFYGVEKAHDDYLRGEYVLDWVGQGTPLAHLGARFEQNASPDGVCDLVLTIDRAVQYRTEDVLRKAVLRTGATAGTIIVMDPRTGALLASASYPAYAPAAYFDYPEESWSDPAISEPYEPGSIFKIVTLAAGLNADAVRPRDTYVDEGCIELGEMTICNLGSHAYGVVDMYDVLIHSLNLGSTYVSRKLGADNFYPYVERFGFADRTGIDLANEVTARFRRPGDSRWHESDLATNSFGQGLAVTPIQMVSAVSAVANRGYLMQPHVVWGMIGQGRAIEIETRQVRQVITEETARTLTDMLVEVVDRGAQAAQVPGYSVAGKSGTAEIPNEQGYAEDTIAGFVGYLPASDPALVILVKIVQPQGDTLGTKVAAPVFSELAGELVLMMGIPPDRPITN